MQTSNPAWRKFETQEFPSSSEVMSVDGSINKVFTLLAVTVASAALVWYMPGFAALGFIGLIAGFILALIISFKPTTAPYLAPVYALCEGLFLGGLTLMLNASAPGLPFKAAVGTFGVLAVMLFIYRSGVIKVTDRFRIIMVSAIGGIAIVYLVSMVMGFFGKAIPLIHGSGPVGIIFSLIVCGIAAFSLLLDFDMIEKGSDMGAPKYMEWYAGFAMLVTLVWLYLEILRLLSKLNSRD